MKSSPPSTDPQLLTGAFRAMEKQGQTPVQVPAGDPFRALDELMVVVEALCPVWPMRPPTPPDAEFRL